MIVLLSAERTKIDISILPKGVYFIESLTADNQSINTTKFVKI